MEKRRILLVDEERDFLQLAARCLQDGGFHVHRCETSGQAIEAASALHFDLLITDALLPRLNGRDLAGRMVAYLPRLKVLFTSIFSKDTLLFHKICPQGSPCIQKPFTEREMVAKAAFVLESHVCWVDYGPIPKSPSASGVWSRNFQRMGEKT